MDKANNYQMLLKQAQSLLKDEHDVIANMSNLSALLYNNLPDVSYAGFYRYQNDELLLGPFQGPIACMHIALGKGVCGTAAASHKIQIVPDVHQFSGHIACDSATNSEIVLPIMQDQKLIAVLDLDSKKFNRFDQTDATYLAQIGACIIN
ncbi:MULTISPECIES: GAF domain-containing protein [unclassified Lactobacillus]|uniref:GAF domain-containing protein n=1 Tax=unclassified Lactobacillus TaxID=2620435 RepID=UPI002269B8B0|nr:MULTISPECIES: GAF domain-containing protein [unclassified Lactobacillus]MCX8720204.1 GAF domain-containing protein [Lactobacillus sp. B4010]MCX8722415.1 GAF domain-containing protein [Lactobacillus sp. B4005]MCX8733401.1 GAF domain-containing protein [Lactobacillus sp. B4015]MCX8735522.1 GAF domain-containing protein [Lactobacillus sp. B4012]